uniref:Uncharacterized protein n=1 Tax=Arundo donax TaxID=35708 RepID=A0A0A9HVM0_ARUDO
MLGGCNQAASISNSPLPHVITQSLLIHQIKDTYAILRCLSTTGRFNYHCE